VRHVHVGREARAAVSAGPAVHRQRVLPAAGRASGERGARRRSQDRQYALGVQGARRRVGRRVLDRRRPRLLPRPARELHRARPRHRQRPVAHAARRLDSHGRRQLLGRRPPARRHRGGRRDLRVRAAQGTVTRNGRGVSMTARRLIGICVGLALWLFSAAPAQAQGVGAIGGSVTDTSGAVLPGAVVTLSNPRGSIGGNQEAVTDARGAFQFIRLVPGTYTVKAELEGFRAALQENIVVNADVTSRVDLKLEIGTLQEGITVTGEAPLLDTTSALKQTVLSREVLDSLPNRIDVWSVARVIPSVVLSKVDVGGSESFLQSTATVHGSNNENGFLI